MEKMDQLYWIHCNKCGFRLNSTKDIQLIICSCLDVLCSKCFAAPLTNKGKRINCILCNKSILTSTIDKSLNQSLKKLFVSIQNLTNYSFNDSRTILSFQNKQKKRSTQIIVEKDKKIEKNVEKIQQQLEIHREEMKKKELHMKEEIQKYEEDISKIDDNIKRLQGYYDKRIKAIKEMVNMKEPNVTNDLKFPDFFDKNNGEGSTHLSTKSNDIVSLGRCLSELNNSLASNVVDKSISIKSKKRPYTEFSSANFFDPSLHSTPLFEGKKKMLLPEFPGNGISPILDN